MWKWQTIWRAPVQSIGVAALVIAAAGALSRILGFVRDRLLAATFGAGDVLDAYYAAFRIPDMLFDLFVLGALSAAFIPVFATLRTREDAAAAWRMAQGVFVLLAGVLVVAVGVLFFCVPHIMPLLVPGFAPEKMALTVTLTRVMLLSPLILGMSAVFGSILMALKRFVIYAFAPLVYNVGIIIGVTVLVPLVGPVGLAWGVVLGAAFHFLITAPAAVMQGFTLARIREVPWRNSAVREVLRLMVPRMIGAASGQLRFIVVTFFASRSASGALAAFNFAHSIAMIPLGIIGVPFAVAAFPSLSAAVARGDHDAFVGIIVRYIRRTIFLIAPIMVLLIVLRAQIVRVVLGAGAFDWQDTIMTFQMLALLAATLFAAVAIPLLARAFYALHDTATPVAAAMIGVVTTIVAILLVQNIAGPHAVAAGMAFGALVNFVLLFILLERRMRHPALTHVHNAVLGLLCAMIFATIVVWLVSRFEGVTIGTAALFPFIGMAALWCGVMVLGAHVLRVDFFYVKVAVMAVAMAAAMQVVKHVVGTVTDLSTFSEVFGQLIVAGSIGAVVYIVLGYILDVDEVEVLRARVWRFIMRRNVT